MTVVTSPEEYSPCSRLLLLWLECTDLWGIFNVLSCLNIPFLLYISQNGFVKKGNSSGNRCLRPSRHSCDAWSSPLANKVSAVRETLWPQTEPLHKCRPYTQSSIYFSSDKGQFCWTVACSLKCDSSLLFPQTTAVCSQTPDRPGPSLLSTLLVLGKHTHFDEILSEVSGAFHSWNPSQNPLSLMHRNLEVI